MSRKLRVAVYDLARAPMETLTKRLNLSGLSVLSDEPMRLTAQSARPDADVWLNKWSFNLKAPFLECHKPKLGILTMTVGTDHIDMDAVSKHGLQIETCPSYCSNSVAEHAIALALRGSYKDSALPQLSPSQLLFTNLSDSLVEAAVAQILFRIRQLDKSIERAKAYDYGPSEIGRYAAPWSNQELLDKRIGIVGTNGSAKKLIKILKSGFGSHVLLHHSDIALESLGAVPFTCYEIGKSCAYVFLNDENIHFSDLLKIDARRLEPSSYVLSGSKVAVLGAGKIGSRIAEIAKLGFDCDVTVFSRTEKPELSEIGINFAAKLQTAISDAQFIFVALPLTAETTNIINASVIAGLDPSIPRVMVNVTRDKIIDSEALYSAIESGVISVYATDVLPNDTSLWVGNEPDEITSRFAVHPRVIATPHEADSSVDSAERLASEVIEKLKTFKM
ncbi:hypothetical protein KKE92_05555 [Candidatus Micrarchaeota archaeon]|nr:hypothetical protein [Candidatus Micrarchaeota archaeon]MBU1681262.1 hypothetical protein [Candidatus Micrarchaeota archaeon]